MRQKIVTPMYTDYQTEDEANNAWNNGEDFLLHDMTSKWNGMRCSCWDFPRDEQLKIRFNRRTEIIFVKGGKP